MQCPEFFEDFSRVEILAEDGKHEEIISAEIVSELIVGDQIRIVFMQETFVGGVEGEVLKLPTQQPSAEEHPGQDDNPKTENSGDQ
jgi:hypothetical protein